METRVQQDWQQTNKEYLLACLARVRHILERESRPVEDIPVPALSTEQDIPTALETICSSFHLSPFERDILLVCVGMELDREFATLCATAQGDSAKGYPTFSLALALLPDAHWSAFSPGGPLRYWQLIEVETSTSIMQSRLHIAERLLHYLLGVSYLDAQLQGLFQPLSTVDPLVPSHQKIAQELVTLWQLVGSDEAIPAVQLCGKEPASLQNIALTACMAAGYTLFRHSADSLLAHAGELEKVLHLWERETILSNSALLLHCHDVDGADMRYEAIIARVLEKSRGPVIIVCKEAHLAGNQHTLLTFDVGKPTLEEQKAIWQAAIGDQEGARQNYIDRFVAQFHLSPEAIYSACMAAQAHVMATEAEQPLTVETVVDAIWTICRQQANRRMDDLAQRIESSVTWDDLILPDSQRSILHAIAMHVRQRTRVYETWGFAKRGARGLGISALFAGGSGSGKTMAAEVLANELRLDLYRIDLSAMVSKYIGETEKNLRRIFEAAEGSGAILLFDEADALFGKRSEVKDSHDRYANIEVSYLLQSIEAYRGLAILTTNMKDALDSAFLRRIRFIVQFPFPDAAQRAEIWQRIFPAQAETEALAVHQLAQLNISGGHIRNIALHAAFIAADCGEPVRMGHILRAARLEYAKIEKPLTQIETRGWDEASEH